MGRDAYDHDSRDERHRGGRRGNDRRGGNNRNNGGGGRREHGGGGGQRPPRDPNFVSGMQALVAFGKYLAGQGPATEHWTDMDQRALERAQTIVANGQ